MANTEMLVIKRGYDFSKWLLQHTGKFPKSYRFSVAAKLENGVSKIRRGERSVRPYKFYLFSHRYQMLLRSNKQNPL